VKLIPSISQETDDVTSDFDNIVANAKDCGILFILLLGITCDELEFCLGGKAVLLVSLPQELVRT